MVGRSAEMMAEMMAYMKHSVLHLAVMLANQTSTVSQMAASLAHLKWKD